jgi:hypothetical protein
LPHALQIGRRRKVQPAVRWGRHASGNIRGNMRGYMRGNMRGNIQGTFSVSSADAREPPSQLQEALLKSIKVNAEYNLPTRVPKTRVDNTKRRIPREELRVHHKLPRGRSGNVQGTFWEHSGNVEGMFGEHKGNIQGTLREHLGNIQGPTVYQSRHACAHNSTGV